MLADRFLETYATESLKVMARRRGLPEAGAGTKAELIEFLSPRLFSREANRHLVQSLPLRQQRLLGALKARGCRGSTVALTAAVEGDPGEIRADLQELLELGLLLYPAEGRPLKYRLGECERVWMDRTAADALDPSEVSGALPKLLVRPPEQVQEGHLGLLLADLLLFILEIERRPFHPEPDARDRNTSAWEGLARRLLVRADEEATPPPGLSGRLRFLYLLLDETDLLKVKKGHLAPGEGAAPFFHAPRSRQARTLFEAFKRLQSWNEFRRIPEIVPCPLPDRETRGHRPSPGRVARARARVLAALRRFDPERWYAFSSLRREIKATHPQFLIRRGEALTAGHRYRGLGERGRGGTAHSLDLTADWDRVEGRFIARVLLEPLYWFGAVNLGFDEEPDGERTRLDAFQITREGAYLLGMSNALPRRRAGARPLVIQPDFDVLCLSPDPDTSLLYDLSRFADFTGGDRVVRFALTREGASRGFHDGWNTERIARRLEGQTGGAIPQNVRVSLQAWEQAYRRFRIVRGVTLVEDPDGQFSRQPGPFPGDIGATEVSRGIWRIPRDAGPGLARALRAAGTPVRRFDYEARPGHGLVLGPGLRITRSERSEDWVTDALLARCAVPVRDEPGAWLVHQQAVLAARDAGLGASDLLEMLEARSPAASPEIRVALRAWAAEVGEVAVAQVPLFVCRDPELLRRILATPSLAACLAERLGADVFAVARGRTAAFRDLLRDLGVRVVSGTPERRVAPADPAAGNRRPAAGSRPRSVSRAALRRDPSGEPGHDGRPSTRLIWHREQDAPERTPSAAALHRLLRRAIEERRSVRMVYRADGLSAGPREVFPLRLDGLGLLAYCHRRSTQRTYRVDRITFLEILPARR